MVTVAFRRCVHIFLLTYLPRVSSRTNQWWARISGGCTSSRIRTEQSGGAWCPKQQINRDVYEWLQVDVGKLKVVSLVETQGRFGNGQVHHLIQFHSQIEKLPSIEVNRPH